MRLISAYFKPKKTSIRSALDYTTVFLSASKTALLMKWQQRYDNYCSYFKTVAIGHSGEMVTTYFPPEVSDCIDALMHRASNDQLLRDLFDLRCLKTLYEKQCRESFGVVIRWIDRKKDIKPQSDENAILHRCDAGLTGYGAIMRGKRMKAVPSTKRRPHDMEKGQQVRTHQEHTLRAKTLDGEEHSIQRSKEKNTNPLGQAEYREAMNEGCWEPAKVDDEGYRIPQAKKRKANDLEGELASRLLEARNWEIVRSKKKEDTVPGAIEREIKDVGKEITTRSPKEH
ncbi:MAG: hypothetical protein Q9204_001888 [Flavoplaca sp. TL-2023a]